MTQSKDTLYSEYWRKVEPLADKKYKKLEAISGNHLYNGSKVQGSQGGGDAEGASVLEEAAKAKAALRRDVDENKKECEVLNESLCALKCKVEEMESGQKSMMLMQADLCEQLKAHQQKTVDSFEKSAETCKLQFASVEAARKRLEEQLMAKIMATERAITIARGEELGNAAKERKAMQADSEAIKVSINQLRDEIVQLEARRDAKFHCFVSQNTYDISLVRDAITEEVGEMGRYLNRTKDNTEQCIKELQTFVDKITAELERGMKEESAKVKARQDEFFETLRSNDEKQSRDLETKANFVLDKLAQERSRLESSVRDEHNWAELRLEERKKSVDELKDDLKQEVATRIADRDSILEEVGRERMQREKDESSIITAIEGVVKQINYMNSSER